MVKSAEVFLEYQPYFDNPPVSSESLYGQACTNDKTTVNSWLPQWVGNMKENHAKYGPFKDSSIGQLYGKFRNMPGIVVGSGPSLKRNAHLLKDRGPNMPVISCLHNFHFLEDLDAEVDLYVTLDAGEITVEEVYEGGKHPPEYYWEKTKHRTLAAFVGTHPKLLEKWQGKILFYNCPVPSPEYLKASEETEPFFALVSNGGNVLGSCLYIAKCFLGCNPVAFLGADFSFSYGAGVEGHQFHAWNSKYDNKLGGYIRATDVYGIPVKTWPSYNNFKAFFEHVSMDVPGCYVNCSEGGTLGSYPGGNLKSIEQVDLADFLKSYHLMDFIKDQVENPATAKRLVVY
jgi:hypothetical protein